eukprot:4371036-Karenia_brevis.AAC.1
MCHVTLERRCSWKETWAADVTLQHGDALVAWSDGRFDRCEGGTAAYVISRWDGRQWQMLEAAGCYDEATIGNDSFRMEAIGMESMMVAVREHFQLGHVGLCLEQPDTQQKIDVISFIAAISACGHVSPEGNGRLVGWRPEQAVCRN